jgi:hypothetical protein
MSLKHEPIIMKLKLPTLRCTRCGYEWHPNSETPPKYCARRDCRSPYWMHKRQEKKKKDVKR